MNLLDYQKSGNAFGTNVTEYPRFSVLKGKIPKIPGIKTLPYAEGYIFQPGMNYYEAFFGSRYQIVTQNGFVFFNTAAGLTPVQKKYTLTNSFAGSATYDPFRQSIGSVPYQYPNKSYTLLKNSNEGQDGFGGSLIGKHASDVVNYSKSFVYDLPFNYIQGTGIRQVRFSSPQESPFDGEAVLPTIAQNVPNVDAFGEKYKVFDFKKEQYICIYTEVVPFKNDALNEYKRLLDKHRLNFLSLFFEIPHKSDGYTYSTKGLDFISDETNTGLNILTFDNARSVFDYDRTIERTMYGFSEEGTPLLGGASSFYKDKLLGQDADQKSKEISSIAFQRLKEIEDSLYNDRSFDVESTISIAQYEVLPPPQGHGNGGGIGFGPKIEKTNLIEVSVPSGIPVNPKAMDGSLVADKNYLTADVTPEYNYLNATWENALVHVPEIAIPNVYDYTKSLDKGFALKEAFFDLGSKAINCLPYEDFVDASKSKKLIFIGDEDILKSHNNADFKKVLPMHNVVEFDIYSNANREIHDVLHGSGIYKDFLFTLLTLVYGPKSDYEVKYDLSLKTDIVTQPEVTLAHKQFSKSLMAAAKYFLESSGGRSEQRITSLKPSTDLPQWAGAALQMSEDQQASSDFERWYQSYLTHLEVEYNLEGEAVGGKPLIDKSKFKEYFTDYSFDTFQSPTENSQIGPVVSSIGNLKSIFADKMREINEILSKKPSYSEPIMYRIEKLDFNGKTIQNIFIPHFAESLDIKQIMAGEQAELTPKIKKLRYIDSQVKYGKVYRYKITQYRIVVGSEYRYIFSNNGYTNKLAFQLGYSKKFDADTIVRSARQGYDEGPMVYNADMIPEPGFIPVTAGQFPFHFYSKSHEKNQNQDVGQHFEFGVFAAETLELGSSESYPKEDIQFDKLAIFKSILYPSIRIEEVPYYEEEVVICDLPPIPPNVNFDPLVGRVSKLLMTFENQTGDREELPIIVEPDDEKLFNLQRTSQNRNARNEDGTYMIPNLRFKSDDFPKRYQVFKLDTPPNSYADFIGKKYKDLDVEEATAFIEDLEPNKTFYFMFRAIDIHDNVSNPSAVFAVQMTFDSGVYFPVVNTYEFNSSSLGTKFRQFQQYLKIEAAMIQKLINKEKSGINNASSIVDLPILGIGNHSLWNQKKFKFRVISKHTGKIIDLNIKFKTNHTNPIDPAKGC